MEQVSCYRDYRELVDWFRELTSQKRENGHCCMVVFDGVPECCEQIAQGARLYFTYPEVQLMPPGIGVRKMGDGSFDLDRSVHEPDQLRDWLRDGWLANTLESASHPLRPILNGSTVIGTVAINGCNRGPGYPYWRAVRDVVQDQWQSAVDLVGVKPYYVTSYLKPDWLVL